MGEWKISSKNLISVVANVEANSKIGEHFIYEKEGIIKTDRHNLTALTSEDSEILSVHVDDMWNILHDAPIKAPESPIKVLTKLVKNINKLDEYVINSLSDYMSLVFFEKGSTLIEQRKSPEDLLIFFKGKVELIWEDSDCGTFYSLTSFDDKNLY